MVSCHTADFKPVKQEVKGTVILPPLEFPGLSFVKFVNFSVIVTSKARAYLSGTCYCGSSQWQILDWAYKS
jgi:hypothetical protein